MLCVLLLHFAAVFSSQLLRITVITNIFCWSQRVRYNQVWLYSPKLFFFALQIWKMVDGGISMILWQQYLVIKSVAMGEGNYFNFVTSFMVDPLWNYEFFRIQQIRFRSQTSKAKFKILLKTLATLGSETTTTITT